jgi:transposase
MLFRQQGIAEILRWSYWRWRHQGMSRAAHWRQRHQGITTEPPTVQQPSLGRAYPSDLTDRAWAQIARLMPAGKRRGRPYEHARREIVNAYCSIVRTGQAWRRLPPDFPPWQTVHWQVTQWQRAGILAQVWSILDAESGEQAVQCIDD